MREPADPRFRSGPPGRPDTSLPAPPAELADVATGAAHLVWVKPGSEVWRVDRDDASAYVKIMDERRELDDELDRLRWLDGRSPVATPRVLGAAVGDDGRGWLATAALDGKPSHDPSLLLPRMDGWIEALGRGLRRFHDELPVMACPFHLSVDLILERAEARVARGGVDPSGMASATYRRLSPERLLEHLASTRPLEPTVDQVVAHGDPVQPNLLVEVPASGRAVLAGMVDVGRLGVSDRYRDLAIITRSLVANLDGEASAHFLDAYGLPRPDLVRLEWYVLADDLW